MIDITGHDTSPPAPGDLELLQRFVNLHEHDESGRTVDPPVQMIRSFLVSRGLLTQEERFSTADRETYLRLRDAIRRLVEADPEDPISAEDAERSMIGWRLGSIRTSTRRDPPRSNPGAEAWPPRSARSSRSRSWRRSTARSGT
jgi:hypothetical protein